MFRISGFLSAVAMLALQLSGPALAEQVTLNVAYAYPQNYNEMMKELSRRFEEAHPDIKIAFEQPASDYEALVAQLLRNRLIGQDMPDVAFHGLHRTRTLVDENMIAPIDDFIAGEQDWPSLGYIPAMQSLADLRGKSYGLSFAVSTMVVYYNTDLVKQAGGNPDDLPETWEEVLDLAKKIDALGPDISGIYWAYYESNNNWTFHSLVQDFGGRMMTPDDGQIAFDGPGGRAALQLVRGFGEAGMIDMTDPQAMQSFAAGKLGIVINSSSRITKVGRDTEGRFKVVTTPLPRPVEDSSFPAGGAGVMMMTTDPVRQKAAWEFMKFTAGPIGQTIMVQHSGYMPGNQIAVDDPDLLKRFYKENPNHMAPITQLPRMTAFLTFPGENSLKIPTVIADHLRQVVTLERTPDEAMDAMVRDVSALLPPTSN